ncbi:MAG: hypothetical protein JO137_00710 [Hyphomicrobiales bacterium]|nr:hypothetical protein [Hyphomicrobiales bacterium]MBV9738758.1 hypothetical protein [Hyphomicrobiales bacterium]
MADEPVNLILEFVRRIDRRLENVETVVVDMRARLHSLEEQVALMRQDVVRIDHRMDRFDERLQRIEKRLELIEA